MIRLIVIPNAKVTVYDSNQGKDYTVDAQVTLAVHNDQQTLWLESVEYKNNA
jgi:hypothetical protein